jgi:hypothetical protein
MTACERLDAYLDDELDDADRAAYEAHLATCAACGDELPARLALIAALDAVRAPRAENVVARRPRRRRSWPLAVGAAALVAIAAGVVVWMQPSPAPPAPIASLAGDLRPTRGLAARLTYPGAERYRPLDVMRGDPPSALAHEAISLDRLAGLERAGDWHGLAVASLLAGERERAERSFAQAAAAPGVDTDRAALALAAGSPAALARGLDDADRALAAAPAAGAARWNRALVLAGLGLPLAAARDFDRVAALGEPGWADEARTRAAGLRAEVAERRTRWAAANAAGARLIADGTPVPTDAIAVTGYLTIMLYDAVRAAPDRARVEALLPMAQALDAAYRGDHLTAYVRRIAGADFAVRKPLADRYRAVITRAPGADADALLARLAAPGANDDIWLGAIVRTGAVAAHLDDYQRRARATDDPWFAIIAEHEAARAELAAGKPGAAERRLVDALAIARRERIAYRALQLEVELVGLHKRQRNLGAADADAATALHDAAAAGEVLVEMNTLGDLASINQDRYATGLARAYLAELLERSQSAPAIGPSPFDAAHDCANQQYAYTALANQSLEAGDADRARDELGHAPACDADAGTLLARDVQAALVRTQLYRFSHRDDDRARADTSLVELGQRAPTLPDTQRALHDYIAGAFAIDRDRAAGERALHAAIARADHRTDDLGYFAKTRAYSFALLALTAGQAADFAGVLRVVGEALDVPVPATCAVAIAVQDRQSVVAITDAHGAVAGDFVAAHAAPIDPAALVPPALAARLHGCDRVSVLARAPVLGAAGVLPAELAWSYALPHGAAAATRAPGPLLVVTDPAPPAELQLPPLAPYAEHAAADRVILRGADATPTRVLTAMPDASVIELHAHGFIANDISEASYLALTPGLDRQYTLTARDLADLALPRAPLVILAACHAATSSRSLEGGTGLAEAFLRAGARAVIASPEAVRDRDAEAVFARVRDRVRAGADPAIAVRDARQASHADAWITRVVVFE